MRAERDVGAWSRCAKLNCVFAPSHGTLRAFGCEVPASPLSGGEGRSWRADRIVLKRVHDEREASWSQEVLADLVEDGFHRPAPIRAMDGRWVVDGWTACGFLAGLREARPQWRRILAGGANFHRALPRPDATARHVLHQRQHRWAIADRVAWGETAVGLSSAGEQRQRRIVEQLTPVSLEDQLIHGDLSGNVLLDADGQPVVIDFSPYLRPVRYADAVLIGDALLWEGAGLEVLDILGRDDLSIQLLLRALLFRLVAEQLTQRPRHQRDFHPYDRVLAGLGF
jgi:uncharacterized protein (TIGR02569 family)